MKTHNIGRPTNFGELEAGSCFAFRGGAEQDRNYVAVKTMADVFGKPYAGAVAIWPGHPNGYAPTSIGVRLERHREPKHSVFCTGSFTLGELRRVHGGPIEEAGTDEEREMIRLFNSSPELQSFVRDWIGYCYRRREAGA